MSLSAQLISERIYPWFTGGGVFFGLYHDHPILSYGVGDNGELSGDGYANFELSAANWSGVYTAPAVVNNFQGSFVMSNLVAFDFTPTAVWDRVLYLAIRSTNMDRKILWYRPVIEPIPLLQPSIPLDIAVGGIRITHRDI